MSASREEARARAVSVMAERLGVRVGTTVTWAANIMEHLVAAGLRIISADEMAMSKDDEVIGPEMIGPLIAGMIADIERKLGRRLTNQEIIRALAIAGIKARIEPRKPS